MTEYPHDYESCPGPHNHQEGACPGCGVGPAGVVGSAPSPTGPKGSGRELVARPGAGRELQELIDKAEPGDIIVVPEGTYKFPKPLVLPQDVELRGAGEGTLFALDQDERAKKAD